MGLPKETLANPIFLPPGLFTEIERLDDCSVALDIDLFQILQQLAAPRRSNARCVPKSCLLLRRCSVRWLIRNENSAIWLSGEPVSVLDFPYLPKSSCFFSADK